MLRQVQNSTLLVVKHACMYALALEFLWLQYKYKRMMWKRPRQWKNTSNKDEVRLHVVMKFQGKKIQFHSKMIWCQELELNSLKRKWRSDNNIVCCRLLFLNSFKNLLSHFFDIHFDWIEIAAYLEVR